MSEFTISEELKRLIPPLSAEEFNQLKSNVLSDGIREPLVVGVYPDDNAEEKRVLIDGHNRYEIAMKHDLNYQVSELHFECLDDIRTWMDENQIGRRNLDKDTFKHLIGRIANRRKNKSAGRPTGSKNGENNSPLFKKTSEEVAHQFDVSDRFVRDAQSKTQIVEQIAKAEGKSEYDVLKELKKDKIVKEIKKQISSGEEADIVAAKEKALAKDQAEQKQRKQKREKIKQTLEKVDLLSAVGDKRYRVVYADPPWQYGNSMPEYVTEPQDYYLLMSTDEICKMPVKAITEHNAVLFLWSTSPHLPEALEVISSWGFTYKTTFIWDKVKHNMGHYNSVRHEILIVATKGSCTPDNKKLFDSVVSIERGAHSEKPEYFREIIDTLYNYGNKIELFSRKKVSGWDVFGNEIHKDV